MKTDEPLRVEVSNEPNQDDVDYVVNGIISYGNRDSGGASTKRYCLLRGRERRIQGGAIGVSSLDMFLITHLYVDENDRGKGYGTT